MLQSIRFIVVRFHVNLIEYHVAYRYIHLVIYNEKNLRVERIWPEVNNRVNYPLKAALVELVNNDQVDLADPLEKFCISSLTLQVAELGMQNCVASWNHHRIAGKKPSLQTP